MIIMGRELSHALVTFAGMNGVIYNRSADRVYVADGVLMEYEMGRPISDKIYDKRMKSAYGMGVDLPYGPDLRSKQINTAIDELMRKISGTDE